MFFENGQAAFERRNDAGERKLVRKVETLTAKLAHKNEVIGEIMAEQQSSKRPAICRNLRLVRR